jgi:hypothetical protein
VTTEPATDNGHWKTGVTVIAEPLTCLEVMTITTETTAITTEPRPADLDTQLESLFHIVWEQEKQWRMEARIDLAVRFAPIRADAGGRRRGDA